MTTESQKLALLEWAGWRQSFKSYTGWLSPCGLQKHPPSLSSLDVIAEQFEGKLDQEQCFKYRDLLQAAVLKHVAVRSTDFTFGATAPQRLEALVRTLGLWRDQ